MNAIATSVVTDVLRSAPPDDALYEVVDGQRVDLPPMSITSCMLAGALHIYLHPFVKERRLGRVAIEGLIILDRHRDLRRRPDLAFVSAQRWPLDRPIPATGDWDVVPDLMIEVTSPNDLYDSVSGKVREYFEVGVTQVWVVSSTERQILVYDSPTQVRIFAGPDVLEGTILPEFSLKVADLFAEAV